MNDHDDDLDRALAALPLEEPPASLHGRIMAATVYRPAPAFRAWEVWLLGTLVAIAAWLTWVLVQQPHAAERLTEALSGAIAASGFTSAYTLLWLAVGVSAAWWISQLTIPRSRRNLRAR
ncbi:MAG TPA: hypothetical protein VHS26_04785 [Solirubrobacteraceae bacterium]|jgi:hypothetical protein|nr:hypothetical protein [Solirubrobacteraceae bacterium]